MRSSIFLSSLLLLFAGWVQAKTLIISDIDDTIKVSHILSLAGKLSRASDITTPFAGMADLYRVILNQNPENSRIVYLSNAPEKLAGIPALEIAHKSFLSFNRFPYGDVELREDIFDANHKINSIRRLVETERPDILILVGDNGEQDAETYHTAFGMYSGRIRILTFIHQLYSVKKPFFEPAFIAEVGKPVFPEQVGFVTPVEVSLELLQQNVVNRAGYEWMVQNVGPAIASEDIFKWDGLKPISFPAFENCRDFVWRWSLSEELKPLYQKIMSRCR